MGRQPGWKVRQTGRPALRSPGRPSVHREIEQGFWRKIAERTTSEDAGIAVGVSGPVGTRWFRQRGGMPSISLDAPSGRYLANRQLGGYVQERLAGQVRRADGTLGPRPAPWKGRNKPRRQDRRWALAWSPEQIANRLKVDFPDDASMRISHEAYFVEWASAPDDRTLGVVDFSLFPHLDPSPTNALAHADRWAADIGGPVYAIDEQTAIQVIDGSVDVISEGQWTKCGS
jgi:hypothetical protein